MARYSGVSGVRRRIRTTRSGDYTRQRRRDQKTYRLRSSAPTDRPVGDVSCGGDDLSPGHPGRPHAPSGRKHDALRDATNGSGTPLTGHASAQNVKVIIIIKKRILLRSRICRVRVTPKNRFVKTYKRTVNTSRRA